jgi:hypothetical protein
MSTPKPLDFERSLGRELGRAFVLLQAEFWKRHQGLSQEQMKVIVAFAIAPEETQEKIVQMTQKIIASHGVANG